MARMIPRDLIVLAILGGALAIGVAMFTAPHRELNAWKRDVISRLGSAKAKPPSGVNQSQWEEILAWTQNAFHQVFFGRNYIVDKSRFIEFQQLLADRLDGDIDLATVAWIWDQLAIHSTIGVDHGRRFRSVAPYGEYHLDENNEPTDNVRVEVERPAPNEQTEERTNHAFDWRPRAAGW